jgi:hypothetical protein
MPRKTFVDGQTLPASDLNNFLMNQSVMTFTNAAARTTAITSPVEGMLTYLEDTNRYSYWNGSAWVSPFGSTLLASANITSTTSFSVNDVFSAEFDNYQLVFSGTAGAGVGIYCRVRSGGTDVTSGYSAVEGGLTTTFFSVSRSSGSATSMPLSTKDAFTTKFLNATIYSPFAAETTRLTSYGAQDAGCLSFCGGDLGGSSSYTGITLISSNGTNFSGGLQIYGLRK